MQYLGINYEMKHAPKLDPTFIPFGVWRNAYLEGAKQPIAIAVERDQGQVSVTRPSSTALPRWPRPTTAAWSVM